MHEPFFRYLRLFHNISEADEQLLAQALHPRHLRENEVLVRAGLAHWQMFFIAKGVLRIMGKEEDGMQTIYAFCKENYLCPIVENFIKQVPATDDIQAACPTEILVLSREALIGLCEQLPYLRNTFDLITRRQLLEKEQLHNQYAGKNAVARYQLFLHREPDIPSRVSLRDVASYLGVTQQSLSRIRRLLAN